MNRWSRFFPRYKRPFGYLKLMLAHYRFFDHYVIDFKNLKNKKILSVKGKRRELAALKNKHKGERVFIIGNGPSLQKMDLSPLKNEFTIGCNGIYKQFEEWGFHTDYLIVQDVAQTELRGKELSRLKGPVKLANLSCAHALSLFNDFLFFYTQKEYKTPGDSEPVPPMFTEYFHSFVFGRGTVAYAMMQLAYFLGFKEIYVIGIDHNYPLSERFPPGKLIITEENYGLVQECHFDKNYYKIGEVIGVPNTLNQDMEYAKAREFLDSKGVIIKNAGVDSKLKAFEFIDFKSLF